MSIFLNVYIFSINFPKKDVTVGGNSLALNHFCSRILFPKLFSRDTSFFLNFLICILNKHHEKTHGFMKIRMFKFLQNISQPIVKFHH